MAETLKERKLQALFNIAQIMGHALDLDQSLTDILRILAESLDMQRATLTLQDDDDEDTLVIRASHGLTEEEAARGVYRLDEGVTGRVFRSGQPFVVPDIAKEPLFLDKTQSRRLQKGKISFIGVPIVLHGQPIGVLNVDRLFEGEDFEEDTTFLTIVAQLIAQFVSINRQVKAREKDLRQENLSLRAKLSESYHRFFIVGKSQPMVRVQQLIEKVSPTRASVLLLGESGTGKTLTARIIHELSDRSKYPFIKVNCASLPETLLESELFGHEKGAFTGATSTKPGRFEEADKGAIFMDEIGEISLATQAKLLRFLQEREFERLGSTKTRKVDVRIITATNKNLEEEVARGAFREDLYYRLNVFPILVPPLRERKEDIPPLLNHFLDKLSKEYGRRLFLTPKALDALTRYDWPGNVREMENLVERLSIMVEGESIDLSDIPSYFFHALDHNLGPHVQRPGELLSLKDMEKHEVISALERNDWVQSRAARELGITLRQMGYRVKKFDLDELVQERRRKAKNGG